MQKIIFTIGLLFCAITMFAQSACVTAFEKAMCEKYNDVFDKINFSAAHWIKVNNDDDIDNRKDDLKKFVNTLAKKLGANLNPATSLDYLKTEPVSKNTILGTKIINEENNIKAKFYADPNSIYYQQIQVNKAYLKKESAEIMIKSVAEEVYHAYQLTAVETNAVTTIDPEIIKQWRKDIQSNVYDLLPKRTNELLEKQEEFQKGNLNSTERTNLIIEIKRLEKDIAKLSREYEGLLLEEHAKDFSDIIQKVYIDKTNNNKK